MSLSCPIVFLVFNRAQCTERTFAEIRRAQPRQLFVVADGPRLGRPEERAACLETRKVIDQGVDWPCQVRRCYSDTNLGCAGRVASGLNWAFSNTEEAIVLEDDCLPDPSFFGFCEELLAKYRHDTRIGQICGTPFIMPEVERETSYIFSRYGPIWGWASWRRAWSYYDLQLCDWPQLRSLGLLSSVIHSRAELRWRSKLYDSLHAGSSSTWDFQWGYAKMSQSMLSVIPCHNLIENIGFGVGATHTSSGGEGLALDSISAHLSHPRWILPDAAFDAVFSRRCRSSILSGVRGTLGRALRDFRLSVLSRRRRID
jgi:hypothetical protein